MTLSSTPAPVDPRRYGGTLESSDIATRLSAAIRAIDLENRLMRAHMASTLGLSDNEFGALAYICEVDSPTPKSLVQELGLTTGAVTAMIDRLEIARLIERHPHPTDRRSTVLGLTGFGEAAREWIFGSYRKAIADATSAAGDATTLAAIDILLSAAGHIRAATATLESEIPDIERLP